MMETMLERLASWRGFRAVVVGDFMLDELVFGEAERLSADAPVPVLRVTRTERRPGGAANLCLDLAALGGRVSAVGVVGHDEPADALRASLEREGVDAEGLVGDPARPTTQKQNLIGLAQARHPQKMFRLDRESRDAVSAATADALVARAAAAAREADVVCIEDYNKGVCSEDVCQRVIEAARRLGKPVLVDPASLDDYARYRGATAITPNRTEAERATGLATHETADRSHNAALARRLRGDLDLDAVVLTLDRHGALLLEREGEPVGEPVGVPTVAREVYDVTGAGDMMLAGLAAARANGFEWAEAVAFANAAAGLEVEQFGVAPIPFERVYARILHEHAGEAGKVRTLEQARLESRARRGQGQTVVFTNGCFDLLHKGHVTLLERARSFGDYLVIGLNTDASVRRLKGDSRPVNNERDRATVLAALEAVDAIVLFDEDTPEALIQAVEPDVLVKGADYAREEVVGGAFVESRGGRIELVDLVEGYSTTGAIERLKG
ncbi:MAG: D-glycero-beta-D-manno-heptose 1-phosphate adenylyltransferase [Planctomycetota bacterium]